jgi:aminomethyltransferase
MSLVFFDQSDRGRIRATGEDRKRLLHAMTTNHVQQLEPGQGLYAFFLNAQGRILADAILLCEPESLLLSLEPEARAKIFEHLDKFIIADDVTLADETEASAEIALEGNGSAVTLTGFGLALPASRYHFVRTGDVMLVRHAITASEGFRLLVPAASKEEWMRRLQHAGATPASLPDVEAARIAFGTPRYGSDITESNLVQETGQMHAVHFSKGCYLGQEIVERVRARGHVNRTLVQLNLESAAVPAPGTPIICGDREGGAITSAARFQERVYALGYLRVEMQKDASLLRVNGSPVELL